MKRVNTVDLIATLFNVTRAEARRMLVEDDLWVEGFPLTTEEIASIDVEIGYRISSKNGYGKNITERVLGQLQDLDQLNQ